MVWADELVEALKKLYADGLSGAQIAAELGYPFTRNAVIGKIHRLGLQIPTGTVRIDREKVLRQRVRTPRQRLRREAVPPRAPHEPVLERLAQEPAPVEFLAIPFEALTADTCRWPRGEGPFFFCGQPPVTGCPYCPSCYRRSINPGGSVEAS